MSKVSRSQKFISFSDLNPVGSIFTAAVSQHSRAPPRLPIFTSAGANPIEFQLCIFQDVLSLHV